MTESGPITDAPARPLTLFGIAVTGVVASAALGAVTHLLGIVAGALLC